MKKFNLLIRVIILSTLILSHFSANSKTRRIQKAYCNIAISETQKATSSSGESLKLNENKDSSEKKSNK